MLTDAQIYILGALREKARNWGEIADRVTSMSLGKALLTNDEVAGFVEEFLGDELVRPIMPPSAWLSRQRFEITAGGRAALTRHIQQVLDQGASDAAIP